MTAPSPSPGAAACEANAAIAVYTTMVELEHAGDRQDESSWRSIALRLMVAADKLEGDRRVFVRDRGIDARSRADTIHLTAVVAAREATVFS